MFYIVVDSRGNFCSDIENRLAICDDMEMEVHCFTSMDKVVSVIGQNRVDAVFVADNVLETPDFFVPNAPMYAYSTKPEGAAIIMQKGIPSVGQVGSAKGLIDILNGFQIPQPVPQSVQPSGPYNVPAQAQPVAPSGYVTSPNYQTANGMANTAGYTPQMPAMQGQQQGSAVQYQQPPVPGSNAYNIPPQAQPVAASGYQPQTMNGAPYTPSQQTPIQQGQTEMYGASANGANVQMTAPQQAQTGYQPQIPTPFVAGNAADDTPIQLNDEKRTKVAAFYSAKGGVGKTTLSSEVAAYLSLTCRKRGNLKVCIVDYNIDFGDVLTTLGFAPDGVNMCVWASEIQERIQNGESPDSIVYEASDIIGNFLQRKSFNQNSEIFALLAPPTHEDSMSLSENALDIMLKNIINCGEFDFVICDTGNNTRDSSIIALDYADYIFMILTQDVTAINCNDSFIATMRKMSFDESRVRLIINNITSAKETKISVSEIEQFVRFPCVARIKRSPDVIKANNQSVPLVFKTNHEFTKELRKIILFLIYDGEVPAETKKGFLSVFKKGEKSSSKNSVFGKE